MVAVPEQVTGRRLTFEDYQTLPDDQRYEIVRGVLHVAPRPRPLHQRVAFNLAYVLKEQVENRGLGTVVPDADLIVAEHDVYVAPDIMVFAGDRFSQVDPEGWIRIVPDLVVEVSSPSTDMYDERTKRQLYAEIGVPHYWRVNPSRRTIVEGVLATDGRYQDRTWQIGEGFQPALFPELQLELTSIFE
ncbi:MAG TPA: Uma2 family endonuclease [Chloroflexota bacterium]|nr:Uma2 family endonuclease [Chloroflexota bacterium]